MSKSCSVPWQLSSSLLPPSPHLPFTPHSAFPQAYVCSIHPHPGTSQNSPVTPYVLVPCLHFPPSPPPPPLPTVSLPPALHRTLCFTLACFLPSWMSRVLFCGLFSQKLFLGDLWCGLIQLSSLSLAKNRDKMDDTNHKNRESHKNLMSIQSLGPNSPECFYFILFFYLINLRHLLI